MGIYITTPSHISTIEAEKVKYTNPLGTLTNVKSSLDDLYAAKNPVYFGSYMEFPNVGSEDTLYIDKSTTYMYLWDTETASYKQQVSDVTNYIFQSTL